MDLLAEGIVVCPYCGQTYTTIVDTSQSSHATIEDCPVCCRPNVIRVEFDEEGDVQIWSEAE